MARAHWWLGIVMAMGCGSGGEPSAERDAGAADASDTGPDAADDAGDMREPRIVDVRETDDGWEILRNGEPYDVRGAGFGDGGALEMDLLQAAGANTLRTWGTSNAQTTLDLAEERGMTVLLGIWLGQVERGFDYTDADAVAAQLADAEEQVERYKDHPALLAWGVGNEVELGGFDLPEMWAAIEGVAAMVARVDPEHPTVVVTAEIGETIDQRLRDQVPSADIWGINAYGGVASLVDRLDARSFRGPYLLTEYGPRGIWEVPTTSWGAPAEPLPSAKAADYAFAHAQVLDADPRCLGGYAFYWGRPNPMDTWYSLVTSMGGLVEPSEALRSHWGGAPAADLPPVLQSFSFAAQGTTVSPGAPLEATLVATDDDALSYTWAVHVHDPPLESAIGAMALCETGAGSNFTFDAPARPGDYRVVGVAIDASGGATTASGHFRVEGTSEGDVGFPLRVDELFGASGWMGDGAEGGLTRDDCDLPRDYCTEVCHRWTLERRGQGWGGVVWHSPANNWEAREPGVRIPSAPTAVTFTAWGEAGGEVVSFFAGNQEAGEPFAQREVTLTDAPEAYRMELSAGTKDDISAGFGWSAASPEAGLTFYVTDIRWVRE